MWNVKNNLRRFDYSYLQTPTPDHSGLNVLELTSPKRRMWSVNAYENGFRVGGAATVAEPC